MTHWKLNMQSPPDVLKKIPEDLPVPLDDGGCAHLADTFLPEVFLISTTGQKTDLSQIKGWIVVFCYPMTGRPGQSIPEGWIDIPGAAGCTPQVCSYRDNHDFFKKNNIHLYGLSTQTSEAQKEAVERLQIPYPLLSDSDTELTSMLRLPLLEATGLKLTKRLTLIIKDGVIKKCFYPVFPPDKNVSEVIEWFTANEA
jgi:peroxiredoxin